MEMSESLLRQRRNLLLSSIVLWFMKYADVSITKASFSGVDFNMNNASAIFTATWIAFAYFLYRYYQYFSDEGIARLRGAIQKALNEKCGPAIAAFIKESRNNENDTDLEPNYSLVKNNNWKFYGQTQVRDEAGGHHLESFEMYVPRWVFVKYEVVAYLDVVFRKSVVTDYLLPFVVALIVLWYCGDVEWNGSFIHQVFG